MTTTTKEISMPQHLTRTTFAAGGGLLAGAAIGVVVGSSMGLAAFGTAVAATYVAAVLLGTIGALAAALAVQLTG
jgi:hypothetical protein